MHLLTIIHLQSCFLKQDRTTTVYGTITDQNGEPVDSILVLASGVEYNRETTLKEEYSDKSGNYEMVVDVPKNFYSASSLIPALPTKNPKFEKLYLNYEVFKNGNPTNNCCNAIIGEKTRYDFQLNPK
ncbi:hypothetical protein [Dyadobacter chenhuakuii]|uniref:Carboxypeptidase family protein n=1 Tax=Dyadobacter chenhuakuii TaxID=2909339 RepID=A0A9X1QHS9_9BACT|nr:hypothetical protein [Dyadobacter chenhuakuii]MCF2499939.1 hypothetical protein [Dyadobacter chenhuakuii]